MIIGIPASTSKTQYFINQAYAQYVKGSGHIPLMITPEMPAGVAIDLIDGLIMPGGIDIDPIYYGYDNFTSYSVDPEKDDFERTLLHVARTRELPILGICRGFQLIINEYLEEHNELREFLTFETHISRHNQVNDQSLSRAIHQHFVDFLPAALYDNDNKTAVSKVSSMPVNSMHHQCLLADFKKPKVIGTKNFKMTAWTNRGVKIIDKKKEIHKVVCEAFSINDWGGPIMAVQWHPEELKDYDLLHNFFGPAENKNCSLSMEPTSEV